MRVRSAKPSDCAAIASAYLESWCAGYRDLLPAAVLEAEAQARSGRDWTSALDQPSRVVLVAEDNLGKIIGVAECEHAPNPGHRPWLQMLYVVASAWGSGAAVELLGGALEAVRHAGHHSTWLEVVDRQARARRFYEREGFVLDTTMGPGSNGLFDLIYYRHDQPAP